MYLNHQKSISKMNLIKAVIFNQEIEQFYLSNKPYPCKALSQLNQSYLCNFLIDKLKKFQSPISQLQQPI